MLNKDLGRSGSDANLNKPGSSVNTRDKTTAQKYGFPIPEFKQKPAGRKQDLGEKEANIGRMSTVIRKAHYKMADTLEDAGIHDYKIPGLEEVEGDTSRDKFKNALENLKSEMKATDGDAYRKALKDTIEEVPSSQQQEHPSREPQSTRATGLQNRSTQGPQGELSSTRMEHYEPTAVHRPNTDTLGALRRARAQTELRSRRPSGEPIIGAQEFEAIQRRTEASESSFATREQQEQQWKKDTQERAKQQQEEEAKDNRRRSW